ncbi:MAG: T9SS type A sorting domain-containing protein [Candidatus Cyclonatronum sp.]|uniref:T9SS type A sorting domain-containing protein n=1 Tax=Cyclonatronum sp. TaxID=3024185 RepID=UPI0025B7CD72|nr:T9SS type A sorting domain-containing protein [Cyclonatronum sp.]MCH8487848.1 T9SS type A sorting domain-containing protein [Cyclonatronum sp.]
MYLYQKLTQKISTTRSIQSLPPVMKYNHLVLTLIIILCWTHTSAAQFTGGQGRGDTAQISGSLALQIEGTEGWRFVSSPAINATYADLFSTIWTQGMEGANDPRTNVAPNVLQLDASGAYVRVESLNAVFTPGSGAVVYVFADSDPTDSNADKTFPKLLSVTAVENRGDIEVSGLNSGSANLFSVVGNPFNSAITFGELTTTGIGDVVFVYDSAFSGAFEGDDAAGGEAGGAFRAWNGTVGSLSGGVIAPFQSFLVFTTGTEAPAVTIPEAAKTEQSSSFFSEPEPSKAIQLAARINQAQVSDIWLSFTGSGSLEQNPHDAVSLYPLDYRPFLSMFVWNDSRSLDIKNLPAELTEIIELPVYLQAWTVADTGYQPMDGQVELIWPVFDAIPDAWSITLTDTHTGEVIDLRHNSGYTFDLGASQNKSAELAHKMAIRSPVISEKSSTEPRLMLTINPGLQTDIPFENTLPAFAELLQNYPNPFNPTTRIRYALPEAAEVRLEVYNILGQRVAVLVNGTQQAGWHTVNFDASRLSSGLYLYRLYTGNFVETRSMMLVK